MLAHRTKPFAIPLVILSIALGACIALSAPPDLPLLPPPGKAPPPAKAEPPVEITRIPVEFTVAVADLEKQMLRSLIQKLDPKAKPVLPVVVKGNARDFPLDAPEKPVAKAEPRPEPLPAPAKEPEALPPPAREPVMLPGRPRLLGARPLGVRPVLERITERTIVGIIDRIVEKTDVAYRIEVRSFKMSVSGQTLTCEVGAGFHAEGKAPPAPPGQPALPPPNVRDISIKLTVTKDLVWSESGKLELKEGTSQVWIDPETPPVGFPRLDIGRVIQLNGLLTLMNGVVDRQVMKQLSAENMPDLATVAPRLKEKLPFFALAEITAYPLRGDGKELYIPLVVGLVPANKKTDDVVKIMTKTGAAPEPKFRGKILFDENGKPDVKLDPPK